MPGTPLRVVTRLHLNSMRASVRLDRSKRSDSTFLRNWKTGDAMSATGLEAFDRTIHKTNVWLKDLMDILGWQDKQKAYRTLKATLHVLRARLTVEEAAELSRNQGEERSLRINASRRGRPSSLTAVNFIANPRPGSTRRAIVSALICPSWTRNSSLAVEPTPLGLCVSRNRPPRLIFRTRETSSRPAQRQSTHTPSCVSTREWNLLEWKKDCCNMYHHRLRAFQRWRNAEVRRIARAGIA